MKRPISSLVLLRLSTVTAALIAVMIGVTFALFQSNLTVVQGSTISSTTAHLLISGDGGSYSYNMPGFAFKNLIPGGAAQPAEGVDLYVKNDGTANLDLAVNMSNAVSNPGHADLHKIWLVLTPDRGSDFRLPLADLLSSFSNGNYTPIGASLAAGGLEHFKIRVAMDDDAVPDITSGIVLSNIDWNFIGNQVTAD